jgi:hypothetical protein
MRSCAAATRNGLSLLLSCTGRSNALLSTNKPAAAVGAGESTFGRKRIEGTVTRWPLAFNMIEEGQPFWLFAAEEYFLCVTTACTSSPRDPRRYNAWAIELNDLHCSQFGGCCVTTTMPCISGHVAHLICDVCVSDAGLRGCATQPAARDAVQPTKKDEPSSGLSRHNGQSSLFGNHRELKCLTKSRADIASVSPSAVLNSKTWRMAVCRCAVSSNRVRSCSVMGRPRSKGRPEARPWRYLQGQTELRAKRKIEVFSAGCSKGLNSFTMRWGRRVETLLLNVLEVATR